MGCKKFYSKISAPRNFESNQFWNNMSNFWILSMIAISYSELVVNVCSNLLSHFNEMLCKGHFVFLRTGHNQTLSFCFSFCRFQIAFPFYFSICCLRSTFSFVIKDFSGVIDEVFPVCFPLFGQKFVFWHGDEVTKWCNHQTSYTKKYGERQ